MFVTRKRKKKFMFNVAAMTWMMSDSRIWAKY